MKLYKTNVTSTEKLLQVSIQNILVFQKEITIASIVLSPFYFESLIEITQ